MPYTKLVEATRLEQERIFTAAIPQPGAFPARLERMIREDIKVLERLRAA